MPEQRKTQSPPLVDVLRAALLNSLTSPIPQATQGQILNQPLSPQRLMSQVGAAGQVFNPNRAMGALSPAMGMIPQVPQASQPTAPQAPQLPFDMGLAPQAPVDTSGTTPGTPGASAKKGFFNPEMLKLLIPALTAGVGTAFPGALAGAAGFQTGFAAESTRQRELQGEKELKELSEMAEEKPSKESLLKMAQNEAFRQMGGSAFGGMALQNPEKKAKYDALVKALYDSYTAQFRGDEISDEANIDTNDESINQEWNAYQSGNL